jgi:hypothetical protein
MSKSKYRMAGGSDNKQMASDTVVANQLNFKPLNASNPIYDYKQISPVENVSQSQAQLVPGTFLNGFPIGTAGTTTVSFNLPINCINWARSYIDYDTVINIAGAGNTTFVDAIADPISGIRWSTQTGGNIVDLKYAMQYQRVVLMKETKASDMITNTEILVTGSGGNAAAVGVIGPTDLAASDEYAANNVRADNTAADFNLVDPLYLGASGQNEGIAIHRRSPLSRWKNTAFAIDKDLPVNVATQLFIDFAGTASFSWINNGGVNTAQTQPGVIQNLRLFLAVEANPLIKAPLLDMANKGQFSINCPYVLAQKLNLSGTSQNPSFTFNNVNGSKLQKVIHAFFHATESNNTCLEHKNMANGVGGSVVASYNTSLNDDKIQNILIDCTKNHDYMYNFNTLKGSAIRDNYSYGYNHFHCDDWTNNNTDTNVDSGLDLQQSQYKWALTTDTVVGGATINHYNFAVIGKRLIFVPNVGLMFDGGPKMGIPTQAQTM